jgi:hypothetical protein
MDKYDKTVKLRNDIAERVTPWAWGFNPDDQWQVTEIWVPDAIR